MGNLMTGSMMVDVFAKGCGFDFRLYYVLTSIVWYPENKQIYSLSICYKLLCTISMTLDDDIFQDAKNR